LNFQQVSKTTLALRKWQKKLVITNILVAIFSIAMVGIEKIELAIEAAKVIATMEEKTVHEWDYEVSSGQEPVYTFTSAEEAHVLRIFSGGSSILLRKGSSDDKNRANNIVVFCGKKNFMKLITMFFFSPEKAYDLYTDTEA
jgi:hypothetical protein